MARGQGEGTISLLENGLYCGRLTVGYDSNGKQKRRAFYGRTKKEVQEKMNSAKVAIAENRYIEPSKQLLGDWLDEWIVDYKKRNIRPSTYQNSYYGPVNKRIKPALGATKLKDLTREMVQKFTNNLTDNGLSRGSICAIVGCLKRALQQAVDNGMIFENVADSVTFPSEERKEIRVLSVKEQEQFLAAAERHPHGDLYIFLLGTGMRVGEARALTWGDVDFEKVTVSINKTLSDFYSMEENTRHRQVNPPKTKAGIRTLPLIPSLVERLKQLKEKSFTTQDSDFIFTDYGRLIAEPSVRLRLKRILEAANLDGTGIHLHTLRHTFATRGLENGVELVVMKELLGHATIQMTADIYTHVMPDKKRDSIMKLADSIIL